MAQIKFTPAGVVRVGRKDATYEWLRTEILALDQAADPGARRLVWVTEEHRLAVARDARGRLEVFIAGEPLVAVTKSVEEVLEFQTWRTDQGLDLPATRIVLPSGDHFDHFGALICVELADEGVDRDAQSAFSAVEPLIALALTRETVSDLTLVGLIGELALLESLLGASALEATHDVLHTWAGSVPSARDFQIGSVGVEVKATQGPSSVHHVEGVHQVELGHSNENVPETALFLLSLGMSFIAHPSEGRSLPELVDSILGRLPDPVARDEFLSRIKQYGGDAAIGYDHARDRTRTRYTKRFYLRFERLYDMTDDRLRLLTSAQLAGLANVDLSSVSFRVVLPDRIRGELNPLVGLGPLSTKLLAIGGLA